MIIQHQDQSKHNIAVCKKKYTYVLIIFLYRYCVTNFLPSGGNVTRKVALICFEGPTYETYLTLFLIKGCMAFISVIFIIATLYVYWLIPDLRETQVSIILF